MGLTLASPGRTALSPAQAPPEFRSGAAAVVLDVVVRDKKGRVVPDVTAAEVEVWDDGVKQAIQAFRWVETEPPAAIEGGATAGAPDPRRPPSLVSLVFDQLSPEGRRLAARAAGAFLERGLRPNTWVAVFQIDQGLDVVQPFTHDRTRLEAAVARVTEATHRALLDEREAVARAEADLAQSEAGSGPDSETRGAPAAAGAFAARAQAQAIANMLRLSTALQRQQTGATSLYPLLALLRGHEGLPGRKALLYLSEGLQVPPTLEAVFRSTVSAANRAQVSVYAIDARGLNVDRAMAASADALDEARRLSQRAMESRGAGAVSKAEIQLADTAEAALRLDVEQTLADLSESTGGFLIANSNDFRQGTERLAADLSGHYELSYTPAAVALDGRFRPVEVKVARKGVVVQARKGYFALPPGEPAALFGYEVPLLAALAAPTPPGDLELQATALRFEDGPEGREHRIIVETPVGALQMQEDGASRTYRVHFSLLARVKDHTGAVVERFSEDYPFQGPLERAAALKLGNIVFKRRLSLPPGSYRLEVAGQDRATGAIGATRESFEVPSADAGAGLSSVVLIRRVEAVSGGEGGDPLEVGGVRIVPNLDQPISVSANRKLSLFVVVYPGSADTPPLRLEFWRDGKGLFRAEPELPAPDPDGRIRYVGTFPLDRFPPGAYEVRVALGGAVERAAFTLLP